MRRILRLTLIAVALVIALAVSSLIVALLVLDDDDYREIVRFAVGEALGWDLEVNGPISVQPYPSLALTGQDAVLSRGETRLAAAKRATFTVELPALLLGQFRFSVDVEDPEVWFTVGKDGRTSWDFEQFAEEGGGFPLEVVIAGIRTGKGRVSFRDEGSGTALDLDLDEFMFREVDDQYEFGFDFVSAYEGHGFRAEGTIRVDYAFDSLFPDAAVYLLKDPAAKVAAAQLSITGTVEDPIGAMRMELGLGLRMEDLSPLGGHVGALPEGVATFGPLTATGYLSGSDEQFELQQLDARLGGEDLQLEVTGALKQLLARPVGELKARVQARDLARLSTLLGTELAAVGPLDVAGHVELHEDSVELTGLEARVGKSDLRGSIMLHTKEERPRLIADLKSERLQLNEIFSDDQAETAEEKEAPPSDQLDRVFSDEPIPLDWLTRFDAQVRAEVKQLALYSEFTDARYALDIENGVLQLNQALVLGDGSTETQLRIDKRASPPRFSLTDEASGVPLALVLNLPEGIIEGGLVNGRARIEGQGSTPRALAAGLNGEILYEMGEARLVEAGLAMVSADLVSGILESLSASGSEKEDADRAKYTDYRCGVFGIQITDGMVRSDRAIALESKKFNVGGDGYIDLRKETLGLAIRPKAKKGLGLNVGTLLGGFGVGGTLSSPEVQFDEAGVAVTVTVGVAVNLLRDWVTVDDFSCANTLKRIKKQQKKNEASRK